MHNILFPQEYFYHSNIENVDELKNLRIENDYHANWVEGCSVKVDGLYPSDLVVYIFPHLNEFLKGTSISPIDVELRDAWKNSYSKGDFQETHEHMGMEYYGFLSGCIFLDDHESDFGEFYFYNRNIIGLTPDQKKLTMEIFKTPYLSCVPTVKKGDIIIFPSYMMHGVSMHKSEKTRTTISFNLNIIKPD